MMCLAPRSTQAGPNPYTPQKLALAKTKSDAVAKVEGVYSEEYVEARRKKAKEDKRAWDRQGGLVLQRSHEVGW